jgi:type VII secretion-associated serine protease mycosin
MSMWRWSRAVAGGSLALLTVMATSSPGFAAAYPKPLGQQWWFTTWGVQDRLWPMSQGQGVTVAVLDTGVEASIPELSGVVLPGADATGGGGDGRTDLDDAPVAGHGTGMASLIAAQGTGTGFVGVAPRVKILPIVTKGLTGPAWAIRFAVDHNAKVINISQAAPGMCPTDLQEAVGYAIQRDVVVLAGAGNDGDASNPSMYPANCAGVVAVGAVDSKFKPYFETQRQPYVAVAAPGVQVGSVVKDGKFHTSPGGTSGATALTSAAVALMRAKYPQMSAREVVRRLIASAGDVGAPGKDDQTGYGLIRPYRALRQSAPKNTPNPVFDAYDKWAAAKGKSASTTTAEPKRKSAGDPNATSIIAVIIGLSIPIVAVVGTLIFMRRRNRRQPQFTPTGQQLGTPPSFGGPYQGQQEQPRPGSWP